MKSWLVLFALFFAFANDTLAQQGIVLEGQELESGILGRTMRYAIYLPPGYEASTRRYPVLYLLHGYTDPEWAWVQFGQVPHIADAVIRSGEAPPMIIVMPEAGVTWYMNDHAGNERYEDYFFDELLPHIEATWPVRRSREFRAVAGLSMGGHGALIYALKHPAMFAACMPLSAAVYTDEEVIGMPQDRWDYVWGKLIGTGLEGEARLTDHWKANNALYLARQVDRELVRRVSFYIDCGDDDFLYKGNAALHVLLRDLNIAHEYRVRDGGHEWSYWRSALPEVLRFAGRRFTR